MRIYRAFDGNCRLLWKEAVGCQRTKKIDDEVFEGAMPGMFYLRYVLQLVVDSLDDCPLPEQQPVGNGHQSPFHVALELGDELNAVHEEALEQALADISFVAHELTVYGIDEGLVFQRLAVVNVTGSYHEVEQLALFVAYQVQLEPEEPAHGALTPLRYPPENLLDEDPLVAAHTQRSAVDETDAGTLAQQHLLDKYGKRNSHFFLQLHKAVVGHDFGEHVAQVFTDMLLVEVLKAAVAGEVEHDYDGHDLCLRHGAVAVVLAPSGVSNGVFPHLCVKKLAKIIYHTENFSNFVLGDHSESC